MPSVRVEDRAFTDPRIVRLGMYLGKDEFFGLGAMTHVWRLCTDLETPLLDPEDVDALLRCEGFVAAMIKAKLAVMDGDMVRVRGTEGRIEWLSDRRAAARKGGEANKRRHEAGKLSGETAKGEPKGSALDSQTGAKGEPNAKPNGSPLALALALAPVLVQKKEITLVTVKPVTYEAAQIARQLLEAIQSHTPEFKRTQEQLDGWARKIPKKYLGEGGCQRLRDAIDYAHRSDDDFWRANILSTAKLCKQLDQLTIRSRGSPIAPTAVDWARKAAKLKEQGR